MFKFFVSLTMFGYFSLAVGVMLLSFGQIDSDMFKFWVERQSTEPLTLALTSILLLCYVQQRFNEYKMVQKVFIALVCGTLVLSSVLTYPFVDINLVNFAVLALFMVAFKNVASDEQVVPFKNKPKLDQAALVLVCLVILSIAVNFGIYTITNKVLFVSNINLFTALIQSVIVLLILRRNTNQAMGLGLIVPLIFVPFVFIDINRSISGEGLYFASTMMLLLSYTIVVVFKKLWKHK